MILATKTGWLISVDLVRETDKAFIVKARDEKKERRVSKDDERQKLFHNVAQAEIWMRSSM